MKALSLLPTAICLATASPLVYPREQKCNGNADLCDRRYSKVSFIGTHDSPFVGDTSQLTTNQGVDVTAQLNAGIRFLQGQTHKNDDGDLHFCHSYCWLEDGGSVVDYLKKVKSWLDDNPNEVLTILLTNGDFLDVSVFDKAFQDANLAKHAYAPDEIHTLDNWPTLGNMIKNDNRLVVFLDYESERSKVPYILSEFDNYFFETPYDVTDENFDQCKINRPEDASADGRMYIVNHFLDTEVLGMKVPDNSLNFRTNAASGPGSILSQADLCEQKHGRKPNFVLVDRFQRGEVFKAQDKLNGL